MILTTEIASAEIVSDNPIHQRLLFAYEEAAKLISGSVLDVGCGEGRGLEMLLEKCSDYTAFDKNELVLDRLRKKYPQFSFNNANVPPFPGIEDNSRDFVVTFQVIEHIEDDELFVDEIFRVLKPGGKAIFSTPNIKMSLTRNPWHAREYNKEQMYAILDRGFKNIYVQGVYGNDPVNQYYEENKRGVSKFTRFDILDLQHRLPRKLLQVPYDILNRMNRANIHKKNSSMASEITTANFHLKKADDLCYDFFCVAEK